MRKYIMGIVVAVLAVVLLAGGAYWWLVARHYETTNDAYLQSDITLVAPKVAGYVAKLAVTDNQQVNAGDVLVRIDDTDIRAKVAESRAAVDARQAAIANIDSKSAWQRSVVAQAVADSAGTEADLKRTRDDVERYRPLTKSEFVSRQKFESAQADFSKAQASHARSQAKIAAERAQINLIETERKQAEAALAQAVASLKVAQTDLDNTVIRAPSAGIVGNRATQIGQYVRVGANLLAIVPLDRVWVEANFKETQLTNLRPGQTVEVKIDAYPDHVLHGTIDSVAPASGAKFSLLPPENATGNFTKIVQRVPVKIRLPLDNELAGLIRPGLSVAVSVDTRGQPDSALATAVARERK